MPAVNKFFFAAFFARVRKGRNKTAKHGGSGSKKIFAERKRLIFRKDVACETYMHEFKSKRRRGICFFRFSRIRIKQAAVLVRLYGAEFYH